VLSTGVSEPYWRVPSHRLTHAHIMQGPTVAVAMISSQSTDQCETETSHLGLLAYTAVELDDVHRTAGSQISTACITGNS